MITKAEQHAPLIQPSMKVRGRLTSIMHALAHWAMLDAGDKVLDMACADGQLLGLLGRRAEVELCGIAPTVEQSRAIRQALPSADVLYAKPEDIPWRASSFDVVMCGMPFYAMGDPGKVLKEALRVLKPGGQFLMAAAWYPAPLRQLVNCFSLHWEDTQQPPVICGKHEMLATLEAMGFEKVSWRAADVRVGVTIGWKRTAWQESLEA